MIEMSKEKHLTELKELLKKFDFAFDRIKKQPYKWEGYEVWKESNYPNSGAGTSSCKSHRGDVKKAIESKEDIGKTQKKGLK